MPVVAALPLVLSLVATIIFARWMLRTTPHPELSSPCHPVTTRAPPVASPGVGLS
jgi:hypothetical protein